MLQIMYLVNFKKLAVLKMEYLRNEIKKKKKKKEKTRNANK